MANIKGFFINHWKGLILCSATAIPAWVIGKAVPVIGGPVLAIVFGMILGSLLKDKTKFSPGLKFASKNLLKIAIVLLGFGINLSVVLETGKKSLPIILATISVALLISIVLQRVLGIPKKTATLIGVGSSICGASAIAAAAPVINAEDDDIAQSIYVIFFFNVLAALIFPILGSILGFSQTNGEAFGIFAGTAINDTSSVSAAASTWDLLHGLGTETLDYAVTVKLTRTLAIIPITLGLSLLHKEGEKQNHKFDKLLKIIPFFVLLFICSSIITTLFGDNYLLQAIIPVLKTLSKFFIVISMASIGINANLKNLVKTGKKPLLLGLACWISITLISLLFQRILGIW